MPWHLRTRGIVLVTLHAVNVERAREWVPPDYRILQFWPGKTLGGLWVAEYGPGSDLEYKELIASCATVWYRGRPALWATHLYVDNPKSVQGGRELLGAPKHFARFSRVKEDKGEQHRMTVGDEGVPICRFRYNRAFWLWRQRVRLPALHRDVRDVSGNTIVAHGNAIHGRIGLLRARVEIPAQSPLAPLGLGAPGFSFGMREVTATLGGAPFLPIRMESLSPPADPPQNPAGEESHRGGAQH